MQSKLSFTILLFVKIVARMLIAHVQCSTHMNVNELSVFGVSSFLLDNEGYKREGMLVYKLNLW